MNGEEGDGKEGFEDAHRDLLSAGDIQFDLPAAKPPKIPGWLEPLLEPLLELLVRLAPYLKYLLWGFAGVGLSVILFLVVREALGASWRLPWPRRASAGQPDDGWRPEVSAARALLAEADALAERGDFAEAVHLLLGRSIEHLSDWRPDLLKPSSTARELVEADLPHPVRSPLARIVRAVELSLFGGAPLGRGDWGECRRAYEDFALPGHWR